MRELIQQTIFLLESRFTRKCLRIKTMTKDVLKTNEVEIKEQTCKILNMSLS